MSEPSDSHPHECPSCGACVAPTTGRCRFCRRAIPNRSFKPKLRDRAVEALMWGTMAVSVVLLIGGYIHG